VVVWVVEVVRESPVAGVLSTAKASATGVVVGFAVLGVVAGVVAGVVSGAVAGVSVGPLLRAFTNAAVSALFWKRRASAGWRFRMAIGRRLAARRAKLRGTSGK
jgi:hypothetical protein